MIRTLQELKDFENRCLGILIYNTNNFQNNIDHHKKGHIRPTIQNIILKFGDIDDSFQITEGEQIAHSVAIERGTQSNSWCPLIWKALSRCGYKIPPYGYFKNPISNVQFRDESLNIEKFEEKFEEKIIELSNIKDWCEYAVRVLNYDFNSIPSGSNDYAHNFPLGSNDFYHPFVIKKSKEI